MRHAVLFLAAFAVFARPVPAQNQPPRFIANTLVVQADGTYETDPDLATLTFDISSQDKTLPQAYAKAAQSMRAIVGIARKNGLKPEEIATGVLTVTPSADHDRGKKPKSYYVQGEIVLKVHDFAEIGPLLDDSVQNGLADFRELTYSLQDEEAAKEQAVALATRNATKRAAAALAQNGQKAGAIRYANVDVSQLTGIASYDVEQLANVAEIVEVNGVSNRHRAPAPPPPPVQPGKIRVSATVQCAFEIK